LENVGADLAARFLLNQIIGMNAVPPPRLAAIRILKSLENQCNRPKHP
jgi:hypothetical protein